MEMTAPEKRYLQNLGINLYRARVKNNESLANFSQKIGLCRQTYRKMEQGSPSIDIGYYIKAMSLFNLI
jgi:DNA-binding XRE family transcriptional regulator